MCSLSLCVGTIVAASAQVSACSSRSFAKLSAVVGLHGAILFNIVPVPLPWPVNLVPRAVCSLLCIFCGWGTNSQTYSTYRGFYITTW